MTSIADGSVSIQTSSTSVLSTPSWFGEVVLMAAHLRKQGVLTKIGERVRFARRRFGHYEVIDFLAVLFGYAISGERTLEAFYERLQPFAVPFMALFERDQLPARSTLSRFLAALTEAPVEALRTLFLDDLLSRPLSNEKQTGGLVDRTGGEWEVFDIDGTREAARQRALPKTEALPAPQRRLNQMCAAGYTGRKRGEVVRTRTVVSQTHSYQWLGSFGNRGNGRYRTELRQALAAITRYFTAHQIPQARILLRLDGQYGTGAVLSDLAGFAFVTRGKEYTVLDHPLVQARLHLPPISSSSARKAGSCVASTTAPRCRWGPKAERAAWWWRPIPSATRRVPLASRVRESSTNSSSPTCRSERSPLPMLLSCICIVGPSSLLWLMKIRRSTLIAGAVTRPGDRSAGSWCRNGSGTCAWNWGISWSRRPCAQRSLLLPSLRSPSRLPPHLLPHLGMVHPPPPPPGKLVASLDKTFLSSLMEHSVVQQGSPCAPTSGAERLMGVCAWCMRPASAVAAPALCATSVNGRAAPPPSLVRSACCSILSPWDLLRSSGVTGVGDFIDESACSYAVNA
jgi:hypothetical protein